MIESTQIIRPLTEYEISTIQREIASAPDGVWGDHANKHQLTALKDGKTVYLNNITTRGMKRLLCRHARYFPGTLQIIKDIAWPKRLGRCYIHKLQPGDKILKHVDTLLIASMCIERRLQIYLDVPSPVELCLDNQMQNASKYINTLVDFALHLPHSYINTSKTPWVFLVFDVMGDKGIINEEE